MPLHKPIQFNQNATIQQRSVNTNAKTNTLIHYYRKSPNKRPRRLFVQ